MTKKSGREGSLTVHETQICQASSWRPVSVEVAAGKEGSVVQPEALEVAVSQEARQQVAEALEVTLAEEGVLQVPLSGGCARPLAQPGIPQELDRVCDKKY